MTLVQKNRNWKELIVSECKTHHLYRGSPAYQKNFDHVLKFHPPGIAPVKDSTGSYHIDSYGVDLYKKRYLITFGFYQGLSAVKDIVRWI